jgi:negative regulator of flagellin synthesis FlgM
MDIRSSLDGLKTILGVTPAASAAAQKTRTGPAVEGNSLTSDRATLSSAGSEVAQSAADGGVRAEKVAEIQAALQAGSYDVPASAVATKMVDAMLERGK